MKKAPLLVIALMVLCPALPLGSGIDEFQGGQKETVLTLSAPSFEASANISLPARYIVLNATLNVTGLASETDPTAYPENVSLGLGGATLWAFNGTGYGPLGRQDLFSDGKDRARFDFGAGGGTAGTALRLPKNAVVTGAVLEVNASPVKLWKELANYTAAPVTDFPVACGCAGDVNGDGYDDILLGGGLDAGRASVYFGGTAMNTTPDVSFYGANASDLFGNLVSGAGDVNGDGYDDVVIGAPENDSAGDNAGSAYIFYGGPAMDNVADVNLTGEATCDWFGYSVSGAGDFDGDGYDDVVVGAENNEVGGYQAGRAYLYLGGPGMDSVPDLLFTGNPSEHFGMRVSGAGDLNGDGFGDVIVGAYGGDGIYTDEGRAYVFFGGQAIDNVSDVVLKGAGKDDDFGVCVAGVGDVNGDGYDDVAAGAPDYLSNYAGRVEIFFGGKAMDDQPDVVLRGAYQLDYFGLSVSGAGDVNSDGYDDIIVGAERNQSGPYLGGRAYLFHGGAAMDADWDATFNGTRNFQYFGKPVSGAGDVDNDSCHEVMVGGNWGLVYLYSMRDEPPAGVLDPAISIGGAVIWSRTGNYKGAGASNDFSQALNGYLRAASPSGSDIYGNYYVDIPLNISLGSEGCLELSGIGVIYEYDAGVPDFAAALNGYIASHPGEQDAFGNLSVPLRLRSGSEGRVRLADLQVKLDLPPVQVQDPVTAEMDEDTVEPALVDLFTIFEDESYPVGALNFSLAQATNSSFVTVAVENNRHLSVDALTGPDNDNWTGEVEAVVACRDPGGLLALSTPIRITVRNVNDPPVITSSPALVAEPGVAYSYDVEAMDGDRDALQYRLDKAPAGMTIDSENGTVRWIPRARGIFQVNILVDDRKASVGQMFAISVPNRPPWVTSTPVTAAAVGAPYSYTATADDPNLDVLGYSLSGGPEGMEIQPGTGAIKWTPTISGEFNITLIVTDGSEEVFQNFAIRVVQPNRPPEILGLSGPNGTRVKPYDTLAFSVRAFDPDGDRLNYSWKEQGSALGSSPDLSRRFRPGSHAVVLSVDDGQYTVTRTFTFTVDPEPVPTGPGSVWAGPGGPVIIALVFVSIIAVGLLMVVSTEVGRYRFLGLFIPLYTRLHKDQVLDNENRGMIRGAISTDPGIHFSEIMRRLDLSNGNALYHLVTLEREGFIKAQSDGRLKRFYPAGMELSEAPPRLDRMQRTIFETLREQNGMSQRDIARLLNVSFSSVNRHINKMASMGVLRLEREGMSVRCYIVDGKGPGGGQNPGK